MRDALVKVVVDPDNHLIGMTIGDQPQLALIAEDARSIALTLLRAVAIAEQLNVGTLQ